MSHRVMVTILCLAVQFLVSQVRADDYVERLEANVNNSRFTTVHEGDNITCSCTVHYHNNNLNYPSTPFWYIQTEELQDIRKVDSNHYYDKIKIPEFRFEHHSKRDLTMHSFVTFKKVSHHFKTIAVRCGVHVQPLTGDHYDIMDQNVIVIRIKQKEAATETPTSTTAAMATTDLTESSSKTPAPCSSLTSSAPTMSHTPTTSHTPISSKKEAAVGESNQSNQSDKNQTVSMPVFIGIICGVGVVLVVMLIVIIGLLACQGRRSCHHGNIEEGRGAKANEQRKRPFNATNSNFHRNQHAVEDVNHYTTN